MINFYNMVGAINGNKYFYGILMLLLNTGSRYIDLGFSNSQKKMFNSNILRMILIFTIVFIATRDFIISIILTVAFYIIILNLLNENSNFCVMPQYLKSLDTNKDGVISPEEIEKAYLILKKSGKLK